jgi:Secretion system C-terminal sorting domain
MQQNTALQNGRRMSFIAILMVSFFTLFISPVTKAQNFCNNEFILWSENFGEGALSASNPDVLNLAYAPSGLLEDGFYRVATNAQQRPEWHNSGNHTVSTPNGNMLVVNGNAVNFYSKIITRNNIGFAAGSYSSSLFLMNVNTLGTCGEQALLPIITFKLEYNTEASGNEAGWVSLQSTTSSPVAQTGSPTWIQLGSLFTLPVAAQRIRFTIASLSSSGCGNDFAIDDLKFATCPSGGPLPVEFLNVNANQKGSGVVVNWSTASENNNKYFDVEKSIDGTNFTAFSSVTGAGNSSTLKNYNSFDSKPVAGLNYYRIKQVDTDGRFKYSMVVKVKINIEKTGVSILTNPFLNNITVDFLSNANQIVNVRLTDVSGKMISTERWAIAKGSTRLQMQNVSSIQKGLYIFTVVDDNGTIIYNNKLLKQ